MLCTGTICEVDRITGYSPQVFDTHFRGSMVEQALDTPQFFTHKFSAESYDTYVRMILVAASVFEVTRSCNLFIAFLAISSIGVQVSRCVGGSVGVSFPTG